MRFKLDIEIPNWTKWAVATLALGIVVGAVGARVYAETISIKTNFAAGETLSATDMNTNFQKLQDAVNQATPPGTVVAFAGATAPAGWLLCDGRTVSRTQYPGLFAAISIKFGIGDSVSTFGLPDLRAAAVRGVGGSTKFTSNATIELGQVVDDQMQGHIHNDTGHAHPGGAENLGFVVQHGADYGGYLNPHDTGASMAQIGPPASDGNNREPRTGPETTGKAIGLNYIIKY